MNARAQRARSLIRVHRQVGLAKRPRKVLARQVFPTSIEREYKKFLLALVRHVHEALGPLLVEAPKLLAQAAREREVKDSRFDENEGKRIASLADLSRDFLKTSLDPERMAEVVEKFAKRTADYQLVQWKRQVKDGLGVDVLVTDRRLGTLLEGFVQENVALIKGIPERVVTDVEGAVARAVQRGAGSRELSEELTRHFDGDEARAKVIARDQIGSLYGQINATRQQELGLTRFIWRSVGDGAVRPEHQERDGKVYSYNDPPDGELPGTPINCRCTAEPQLDDILGGLEE